MIKLTLRNLAAHKRRLIGTSLAVCLGVAFLAGTFVLGDTMAASFDRLFTNSIGETDAVVRNDNRVGGDVETAQALVPQATVDAHRRRRRAWPRPRPRSRASVSSTAPTARRSVASARRPSPATGSRIPT